ncbi:hypothetical protein RI054_04g20340 [Pseudoscourfieldia marina]
MGCATSRTASAQPASGASASSESRGSASESSKKGDVDALTRAMVGEARPPPLEELEEAQEPIDPGMAPTRSRVVVVPPKRSAAAAAAAAAEAGPPATLAARTTTSSAWDGGTNDEHRVTDGAATGTGAGARIKALVGVADSVDFDAQNGAWAHQTQAGVARGSLAAATTNDSDDEFEITAAPTTNFQTERRSIAGEFDDQSEYVSAIEFRGQQPDWLPEESTNADTWAPVDHNAEDGVLWSADADSGSAQNTFFTETPERVVEFDGGNNLVLDAPHSGSGMKTRWTPQEEREEMRASATKIDGGFGKSGDYTERLQNIEAVYDPTSPVRPTHDPNVRMPSYSMEEEAFASATVGVGVRPSNMEYNTTPVHQHASNVYETSFDRDLAELEIDADNIEADHARSNAAVALGSSFDEAAGAMYHEEEQVDPYAMPEFAGAASNSDGLYEVGPASYGDSLYDVGGVSNSDSLYYETSAIDMDQQHMGAPPAAPRWTGSGRFDPIGQPENEVDSPLTAAEKFVAPEPEMPPSLPPEPELENLDPWAALERRYEEDEFELEEELIDARVPPPAPRWRGAAAPPPAEETIVDRDEDDDPWLNVKMDVTPSAATWGLVDDTWGRADAGDVDFSRKLPAASSGGEALGAHGGVNAGDLDEYVEDFEDVEEELARL